MKTASAKAKGRKLQQEVRDYLRFIVKQHGLEDADVESRGMGQAGVDVILSPAAKKLLHTLEIECKNCEKLNVHQIFSEHYEKYRMTGIPLLVHSKNRSKTLVTMTLNTFLGYLSVWVKKDSQSERTPQTNEASHHADAAA
jgi:hypothetical protein